MSGIDLKTCYDVRVGLSTFKKSPFISALYLLKRLPTFNLIAAVDYGRSRSASASCMSAIGHSNCLSQ